MQMYEVEFRVHYEDLIDCGKVLVCASDNDSAAEMVRFHFGLPASQGTFDVKRIKPSIFQIDRRPIHKKAEAQSINAARDPLAVFTVDVTASIRAASESHALRKMGTMLIERSKAEKAIVDKSVSDIEITCNRREYEPRSPAIDRQAIYTHPRFFAGGAARGR